ncbi:MAG TPA: hypothetical protein VNI57_03555, partial [Candidatus Saccharimonadales bacterium]|nr:hypothetical protein [Candidatus Saccharimonadales bacterium]
MNPDDEADSHAPAHAGVAGILLISAAALAVFAGTLRYPYLYDDVTEIRENSRVHRLDEIPSLLTTEFVYGVRGKGFVYRPVTAATIPPLVVAGRGSPAIFHGVNILLHVFISAMLAVALARLWRRRFPALAAGLLFAVLPIHTEAVAWISGRSELLQAAAGVAAWYCHLRAREGKRRWAAAGAWLLLAVALGAKESAVAWPFIFFLGDWLFPPENAEAAAPPGRRFRPGLYLSYGALLAAWVGARFVVLGQLGRQAAEGAPLLNPLEGLPWLPYRPFTALRLLFVAAWKSLAPGAPSIDYGFDQIPVAAGFLHADVAAGTILLAVMLALLLIAVRRRSTGSLVKRLALASAIFLLFWFPVSSLLLASVSIFAERNLYLPSLAFCIAAATAAEWIRKRLVPARGMAAIGLVVLAGTGIYAASRNAAYADPISLYASTARACPASARAHFLLAG